MENVHFVSRQFHFMVQAAGFMKVIYCFLDKELQRELKSAFFGCKYTKVNRVRNETMSR